MSPDPQELDLHAALHVGLDLRPDLHPAFIQLLKDLQVLKSLVHLRSKTKGILQQIDLWSQQLMRNAVVFYSTSVITCRTAGVSGVYNSFPTKSGFIPRHTMRDIGLDSRPRIKLLQNGAAEKKIKNIKM